MINMDDYLMDREVQFPLSVAMKGDALVMVLRVNELLCAFGQPRPVTSGYRPGPINTSTPGAAKNANHLICRACDLQDQDGLLDSFCLSNLPLLQKIGLWLESPHFTPGWCHVQIVAPGSGNRVFIP